MRIATITTLTLLAAWAPAGAQAPSPGGAAAPVPAHVTAVSCLNSCAALDAARPGSTVRIAGSHLDATTKVVFRGARGPADDRTVAPLHVSAGAVDVKVPASAAT